MKKLFFAIATVALFCACKETPKEEVSLSGLKRADFQSEIQGKATDLWILKNKAGMEVCFTNLGARIVSVIVPDKDGNMQDVVLGFDNINDYATIHQNLGATIGRYGNRIGNGKITIDTVEYQLPLNNYGHTLHGGPNGWDTQVFDAEKVDEQTIKFSLVSPDGEANFPGEVKATVTMTLTDDNAIGIKYSAVSDKKTILNLTNHSYFNLAGDASITAMEQTLYVDANGFTPVDSTFMTTGEIRDVTGTPMDFRTAKVIADDIDKDDEQLKFGKGFDHNWVLNTNGDVNKVAATLTSPKTGIVLEVYTNEPGIQVYAGNFLDGAMVGKKDIAYGHRSAVCLETQHFPDSPNKPEWPSVIVEAGQEYNSICIYKFSVVK